MTTQHRLQFYRQAAGLTQAELAAKTGVTVYTVQKHEQGRVGEPKLAFASACAAVLGVSAADIFLPSSSDTSLTTLNVSLDEMLSAPTQEKASPAENE
jgi:transcriptional regulator with XRE-family HTH domain